MNIWGLVTIIAFYAVILVIGLWAGRKKYAVNNNKKTEEEIFLAGRDISLFVGIFTMTATWVGGGYINGTAEIVYTSGLLHCQAPICYAISLVIGGIFFASKMRKKGYVTMLDPIQEAFGERVGGLLYIPALCGEVFWASAILSALGATLSVIIDMNKTFSVILSASIAIFYTLFGGLRSVAYTDVIQLICIFFGLWVCIPFALTDSNVPSIKDADLIGNLEDIDIGYFLDGALLLIFGGIPWQVYFQRVLSCKTPKQAQMLSYVAALGCIIMAIPSILIGYIGQTAVWNNTSYGVDPNENGDASMILPLVLNNFTPKAVAIFGLGAVSAAVMSSADSSVLSASSMFARNIYKHVFRQNASETEIIWVMRAATIFVGIIACTLALTIDSVYGLWALSSDLVYCILFPQLLLVVHFPNLCNTYGSVVAFFLTLFLRFAGGESVLSIPPLIKYPLYNEEDEYQRFPFRTLCMLISLATLLIVTQITKILIKAGKLKELKGKPRSDSNFGIVQSIENNEKFGIENSGAEFSSEK